MFCASKLHRGAAGLKPILSASVSSEVIVQRFIGLDSCRFHNINLINGIMEKANGSGVAGTAAAVANSLLCLSSHNPAAAIEGIDKIYSQIKDPAVFQFAVGTRLRARNNLLDTKETALSVSGGATESEVSSIRAKVLEDYKLLQENSDCWLVDLGHAEFLLYVGKVDEALEQLKTIEGKICRFIESNEKISTDPATPDNSNFFSLTGLKLRRIQTIKNSSLGAVESLSSTAKELSDRVELSLSDDEAIQLGYILEAANVAHHFQEYFPYTGEYEDLNSSCALEVKRMIKEFLSPSLKMVDDADLSNIQKPQDPFKSKDELLKQLQSLPEESPVAALRKALSQANSSPSAGFTEALDKVLNLPASYETSGSAEFALDRRGMMKTLAQQMLFRTRVQIGVALTEKQKYHAAVDVISPVIGSKQYIYVWRALLARSRAHKALGNITESDRDLKCLKGLKKSVTNRTPSEKC